MQTLNTTNVHNLDNLVRAVRDREKEKPLLTICNHTSNIDDPCLFGLLPMELAFSPSSLRWALGAHNVCFKKPSHGFFCSLAKVIPVVRGEGVYQRGMDMILERMDRGEWAHIFPEGKVNMTQEWMRLKWGMGRLVAECRVPPLVLPFWHEGLTDILPHKLPYRLQIGQKVTVVFGDIIDSSQVLAELKERGVIGENADGVTVRKAITDYFQKELLVLRQKARKLHFGDSWKPEILDSDLTDFSDSNGNTSNSTDSTNVNTNAENQDDVDANAETTDNSFRSAGRDEKSKENP